MMHKNSATYWQKAVDTMKASLNDCRPENKETYRKAVIYAEKQLREIRRRAGILI